MIIGFDASRAFVAEPTGTERYSYELLKALLKIDRKNFYRIYINPYRINSKLETRNSKQYQNTNNQNSKRLENLIFEHLDLFRISDFGFRNFDVRPIYWPRLWTQGGLALECLKNPPDVLFIPAHTLPIVHRPNQKTVVTIHDLGAEYLPEYHQFPHKYYINWSTVYAVKHATRIIAVSESTKKDLIVKLNCDSKKISVIYEAANDMNI